MVWHYGKISSLIFGLSLKQETVFSLTVVRSPIESSSYLQGSDFLNCLTRLTSYILGQKQEKKKKLLVFQKEAMPS